MENEVEMKKLATQMAHFFDKKITLKGLIIWHTQAYEYIFYGRKTGIENENANSFLSAFSFALLPQLLDAKSEKKRIEVLQQCLPELFMWSGYNGSKGALTEIGVAYLEYYNQCGLDDDLISEFMSILSSFLTLVAIYGDYEFYRNRELGIRNGCLTNL